MTPFLCISGKTCVLINLIFGFFCLFVFIFAVGILE